MHNRRFRFCNLGPWRELDCDAMHSNSCYLLYEKRLSWDGARSWCQLLGGHLAVIETSAENGVIQNISQNTGKSKILHHVLVSYNIIGI